MKEGLMFRMDAPDFALSVSSEDGGPPGRPGAALLSDATLYGRNRMTNLDRDAVEALAKLAEFYIRPEHRDYSPFEPFTPITHRVDDREGLTLPPPDGLAPELTFVSWHDGPEKYGVVPNWMIQDFLKYAIEGTDRLFRDMGWDR